LIYAQKKIFSVLNQIFILNIS